MRAIATDVARYLDMSRSPKYSSVCAATSRDLLVATKLFPLCFAIAHIYISWRRQSRDCATTIATGARALLIAARPLPLCFFLFRFDFIWCQGPHSEIPAKRHFIFPGAQTPTPQKSIGCDQRWKPPFAIRRRERPGRARRDDVGMRARRGAYRAPCLEVQRRSTHVRARGRRAAGR